MTSSLDHNIPVPKTAMFMWNWCKTHPGLPATLTSLTGCKFWKLVSVSQLLLEWMEDSLFSFAALASSNENRCGRVCVSAWSQSTTNDLITYKLLFWPRRTHKNYLISLYLVSHGHFSSLILCLYCKYSIYNPVIWSPPEEDRFLSRFLPHQCLLWHVYKASKATVRSNDSRVD